MHDIAKDIRQVALAMLARREHSYHELMQKLQRRNFNIEDIAVVLQALSRQSLQSDYRFAQVLIQSRVHEGYGMLRIRNELKQKGISEEMIEKILIEGDYNWVELARQVYQKKFFGKKAKNFSEKAKQMRFLQYRGFTAEQIRFAIGCFDSVEDIVDEDIRDS